MYGGPSYQMADDEVAVHTDVQATAPVTLAHARRSRFELMLMRSSLRKWLKYRRINDAYGRAQPGQPDVQRRVRYSYEQPLASKLYVLLSEVFDANQLPSPDLASNPDGAAQLAEIAIAGKVPGEVSTPQEQGFVWIWPVIIVVGAASYVLTTKIRSDADVAKEKAHLECVKIGQCTDSGFWMKVGAVAFIGWLAWDKLGLGAKLKGALK